MFQIPICLLCESFQEFWISGVFQATYMDSHQAQRLDYVDESTVPNKSLHPQFPLALFV